MNFTWQRLQDANGVIADPEDDVSDPARQALQRDYHWTPACQRAFLEALATTGSVTRAAKEVHKSPRAAYGLKFRKQGFAFKIAWDASILVARDVLGDMLLDRAVNGFEESTYKDDNGTVIRGKFDNGLSSRVLGRLDGIAEKQCRDHEYAAKVQMAVQDYEAFLDLIECGGSHAEADTFFAEQSAELVQKERLSHIATVECELAQNSAVEAASKSAVKAAHYDPGTAAAQMSVWYNKSAGNWNTNFPPPPEFAVYGVMSHNALKENGKFGDPGYARLLTLDELQANEAKWDQVRAPLLAAGHMARDAWFDVVDEAMDEAMEK